MYYIDDYIERNKKITEQFSSIRELNQYLKWLYSTLGRHNGYRRNMPEYQALKAHKIREHGRVTCPNTGLTIVYMPKRLGLYETVKAYQIEHAPDNWVYVHVNVQSELENHVSKRIAAKATAAYIVLDEYGADVAYVLVTESNTPYLSNTTYRRVR